MKGIDPFTGPLYRKGEDCHSLPVILYARDKIRDRPRFALVSCQQPVLVRQMTEKTWPIPY